MPTQMLIKTGELLAGMNDRVDALPAKPVLGRMKSERQLQVLVEDSSSLFKKGSSSICGVA